MEEEQSGWFHCGRCGSLFGALVGAGLPEQCPECSGDPVVEDGEIAFAQASRSGRAASLQVSVGAPGAQPNRRRTSAGARLLMIVVVGWAVVLAGIALAVTFFRGDSPVQDDVASVPGEDSRMLQEAIPSCYQAMMTFMTHVTPEARAGVVRNPSRTVGLMVRGSEKLPVLAEDAELRLLLDGLLTTPDGKAVATVWDFDGTQKVEAVFFRGDEGEWRLDWEQLARYSEESWPLFLAGGGEDEAEFRLLARRRDVSDPEAARLNLGIVLLEPENSRPERVGAASPQILVPKDSPEGGIIERAFQRREAGGAAYGATSSKFDPNGMIRLRVRVRRIDGEDKHFELVKVIATHWLAIDDLGIDAE